MNTAERVLAFFRERPEKDYCDDCVERALRLSGSVTPMLAGLGTPPYFRRENATCERCGQERLTTRMLAAALEKPRRLRPH